MAFSPWLAVSTSKNHAGIRAPGEVHAVRLFTDSSHTSSLQTPASTSALPVSPDLYWPVLQATQVGLLAEWMLTLCSLPVIWCQSQFGWLERVNTEQENTWLSGVCRSTSTTAVMATRTSAIALGGVDSCSKCWGCGQFETLRVQVYQFGCF